MAHHQVLLQELPNIHREDSRLEWTKESSADHIDSCRRIRPLLPRIPGHSLLYRACLPSSTFLLFRQVVLVVVNIYANPLGFETFAVRAVYLCISVSVRLTGDFHYASSSDLHLIL